MSYDPSKEYVYEDTKILGRFRMSTFKITGNGQNQQPLACLWSSRSNPRVARIRMVKIETFTTAGRLASVPPAIIRLERTRAIPGGATLASTTAGASEDSTKTVSGVLTLYQPTNTDNQSSALNDMIVHTAGWKDAGISQEFVPRHLNTTGTASVGYEMYDNTEMLEGKGVLIRPGEGLYLYIDASNSPSSNPSTTFYVSTWEYEDFLGNQATTNDPVIAVPYPSFTALGYNTGTPQPGFGSISFSPNGNMQRDYTNSSGITQNDVGQWLTTGAADMVQVRLSAVSGTTLSGPQMNVWWPINVVRQWSLSATTVAVTSTYNVQLRDAQRGTTLYNTNHTSTAGFGP
jgi:hypothetical protein